LKVSTKKEKERDKGKKRKKKNRSNLENLIVTVFSFVVKQERERK